MVGRMMRWRSRPPLPNKFKVRLQVKRVEGVRAEKEPDVERKVIAEVRWKGPKVTLSSLRRTVKKNRTREEEVGDGGVVEWNEEFESVCTLTPNKENAFYPWEVAINVLNGSIPVAKNKVSLLGVASMNIAEFITAEKEVDLSLSLSLPSAAESQLSLHVALNILEFRVSKYSHDMIQRPRTSPVSPPSVEVIPFEKDELPTLKAGWKKFVSIRRSSKACQDDDGSEKCSSRSDDAEYTYPFDMDSTDDDDDKEIEENKEDIKIRKSFSYGTLATVNNISSEMKSDGEFEDWVYYNHRKSDVNSSHVQEISSSVPELKMPKRSILSWKKRRLRFISPKPKGEPLLNKANEAGGDDIDYDRRLLSSSDESHFSIGYKGEEEDATDQSSVSKFDNDCFVVGRWEPKVIMNRDGNMKLATEIFFASIDQRCESASGESACTALVAVIADWFLRNQDMMPVKSQFDSLIQEGSLKWRKLCENQEYMERFTDKHFDLETIIEAKIGSVSVVSDKSLIGFFHPEGTDCNNAFNFLHEAMSFDSMWDEICHSGSECSSNGSKTQVYIVSWNDHFFVLKIEQDAYYIIDTLGERLYEGCQQAYILKFNDNTSIRKVSSNTESASAVAEGFDQENDMSMEGDLVCRGKETCKEYIKSFLAAIPIRELQTDVEKGRITSTLFHQRLQIEFHYTQ
ncbi:uncharacterized protein LOC122012886 isoform X1 [Zingiber officinale]|uniref:C2 NT-type domain-containing protein n=1 Tax=Zingiber officinale TaxID=94328 RepID=A0A8J5FCB0_ZINOF|nr:uncharacterized protein LOC122012886 isoform X1 [Zingiber officinale]KAG6484801.1 hypothetical protein ZIOFF_053326 [Zingiber officinale]